MVDPVSLGAIGAVPGAVGSGMANEAGKRARESAGGLVRRLRPRVAHRAASSPTGTRIHPVPATSSSASRHRHV